MERYKVPHSFWSEVKGHPRGQFVMWSEHRDLIDKARISLEGALVLLVEERSRPLYNSEECLEVLSSETQAKMVQLDNEIARVKLTLRELQ